MNRFFGARRLFPRIEGTFQGLGRGKQEPDQDWNVLHARGAQGRAGGSKAGGREGWQGR